jgi:hypothetical protein
VPGGAALWATLTESVKAHFGFELSAADGATVRTPGLLRTLAIRVGIKVSHGDSDSGL